jgi:hypothetical protein
MLERIIFTALKEGIAELVADPGEVKRLFAKLKGLSKAEADKIADFLRRLPPDVIHNYPREDSTFPLYAIVLDDESETQKFLDDFGSVVDDEEAALFGDAALEGAFKRTSIFTSKYNIWVVAQESPDIAIAYYQIAKYILGRKRSFFKELGILDTHFAGGDVAPNMNYLPAYLFVRRLTMTCQFEEPVFEEPESRIRSVAGIHVDDGAELEEIGGVNALVTVIEE